MHYVHSGKRQKGNGKKEKREMKTWVRVLILELGVFLTQAGAQAATSTTATNFFVASPVQSRMGAPSTPATNPFFASAFQSKIGSQIATTTNFSLTGVPENKLGVPSTPATNPFFANSFQSKIGLQTGATASVFSQNPPRTGSDVNIAVPTMTNNFPAGATQSGIGVQPTTATNFLFASSSQSWIGQGASLFAAPTNGYIVRLTQIAANILQFNITATESVATNWALEFSTTNDFFTAGVYSNAVNAGGSPSRLAFGGMGRAINASVGAFKVLDATYSSDQIVSFAADFVQFDNDDTNSWNEGSIRYNSTIPDTVNLIMAPVAISFQKGDAVLTWSTNLTDFQLEFATNLPAVNWFTNDTVPAIVDGQYSVTVTNGVSAGTHLYRLMKRL
jgi:hypothetical protein